MKSLKIYHIKKWLTALLVMAGLSSCKKFVDIPPPKNQLLNEAVFADSANATAAVLGIYIYMMQSPFLNIGCGGLTVYPGLSADELYNTSSNSDETSFYTNTISSTNQINKANFWTYAYAIIYNINACLEGITGNHNISPAVKNQLIGEVKFVRAFMYFNLVNLYGDVPLVTTTDYHTNQVLPRTAVSKIYDQIIADLEDSQNLLSINYVTSGRFRPNRYTAKSLLTKVYLYKKEWAKSESLASEIIGSGIYTLESNVNNVFRATGNEAIWKLARVFSGIETWEGYFFVPTTATAKPRYVITNSLLAAFEPGDLRAVNGNWIKYNTVTGQQYYFPYKYKLGQDGLAVPLEHYSVFRLAELYLIRAEARAQQNKLVGANSAEEDINKIRNRAGLPKTLAITRENMLLAIVHERQVELFCEWGNRWFDLKRWDKANAELAPLKPGWEPTDILYPVPQSELDANPFLIQNSGY